MKTAKFMIILCWIVSSKTAFGQVVTPVAEFESTMLSGSAAIPNELTGFLQNPAAASFITISGLSVFQQSYLAIPNLTLNGISFKHGKKIHKGYNLSQFGTPFYRISSLQMALSSKLSESFAAGVLMGLSFFPTENRSPRPVPSFGFGLCWKPYKNWSFGLTYMRPLHNLQQIGLSASWIASDNLVWSFSLEKFGIYPQTFKSGLRYRVKDEYFFLSGFSITPLTGAFGILLPLKKVKVGLGAQMLELVGWQSCISISYPIQ